VPSINEALQRPEVVGIMMALLTCFCMSVLPIFGGISLLHDANYRFWKGSAFPFLAIFVAVAVFVLATVTAYVLYRRARQQDLGEATMVVSGSVFSALLGVALLVVSIESSQGLNRTADALMQGCSSHDHDVHVLNDYYTVLANIRASPACAKEASVESCAGYSENKYTAYLRYMEQEFECGPVCSSASGGFNHERWGLVQESATVEEESQLHESAGSMASTGARAFRKRAPDQGQMVPALMPDGPKMPEEVGWGHVTTSKIASQLESTTTKAPEYWETFKGPAGREPPGAASGYSPKLFSSGYTRTTCLPLVSTRLKVLAFASNDIPFYEGCGLVLCSIVISVVALVTSIIHAKK